MKTKLMLLTAALGLAAVSGRAQISITALNNPYTENFDGLINTGSGTYVDNTTIAGWTVNSEEMDSNSDEYFAADGSSNGGEVYSFGTGTNTDRALGYIGSGGNDFFNAAVTLTNDTGSAIDEITISYVGEQWRSGGNTSDNQNILAFSYQTGTSISIPASTNLTGWTAVNSLDFAAPQVNVAAGALDGNLAANQTSFTNISISGLSWAAGEDLVLRWTGNNGGGTDAGLGIDDLSVTAVPEPSTVVLVALTSLAAFGILRRRQK